jgi:predicted DNA-binding transcriptional regulator AlpA
MYDTSQLRLCKKSEAYTILGVSEGTFRHQISEGLMVPTISLGERAIGVIAQEVDMIIKARIAGWSEIQIKDLVKRLIEFRTTLSSEIV